jgi:peptide subunit release factor 1 (eRF1)
VEAPFLSVYLDGRPNENGRPRVEPYLTRELRARLRTLGLSPADRGLYEADAARVTAWVRESMPPSANGAAVFACSKAGVFAAVALDAPVGSHRIHIGRRPHLYPLLHVLDRYRRYLAVVADTRRTRVYVFGLNTRLEAHEIVGEGPEGLVGFTNAELRYQRHVEKIQHQNAKEVAAVLDRIVREERLDTVLLAGDDVVLPILRSELSPAVLAKVVDVSHLDARATESQVLRASLEAFQRHDAQTDAEKVAQAVDQYLAGGLGVIGLRATHLALTMGQVDELLLSADPAAIQADEAEIEDEFRAPGEDLATITAEELATRARQTDARITFIEDAERLRPYGGVAGRLRFRIVPPEGRGPVPEA